MPKLVEPWQVQGFGRIATTRIGHRRQPDVVGKTLIAGGGSLGAGQSHTHLDPRNLRCGVKLDRRAPERLESFIGVASTHTFTRHPDAIGTAAAHATNPLWRPCFRTGHCIPGVDAGICDRSVAAGLDVPSLRILTVRQRDSVRLRCTAIARMVRRTELSIARR